MQDQYRTAIANFLDSLNLQYGWNDDKNRYQLSITLEELGQLRITIGVVTHEDDETLIEMCSYIGMNIPKENQGEVAKFLCAINNISAIQGFQMDPRDGQVVFKSLIPCYSDAAPPQNVLRRYFSATAGHMRHALAGILQIMDAHWSAETVFHAIFGD